MNPGLKFRKGLPRIRIGGKKVTKKPSLLPLFCIVLPSSSFLFILFVLCVLVVVDGFVVVLYGFWLFVMVTV
jgi:hypothetical protein